MQMKFRTFNGAKDYLLKNGWSGSTDVTVFFRGTAKAKIKSLQAAGFAIAYSKRAK